MLYIDKILIKGWFKLQVFGLHETCNIYSWIWDSTQAKFTEDACPGCGACHVLFLFLSFPNPSFLFLFPFHVYFRDWGGNDLSERPGPVGQWAGTGC